MLASPPPPFTPLPEARSSIEHRFGSDQWEGSRRVTPSVIEVLSPFPSHRSTDSFIAAKEAKETASQQLSSVLPLAEALSTISGFN
jgi:hypothetical protein